MREQQSPFETQLEAFPDPPAREPGKSVEEQLESLPEPPRRGPGPAGEQRPERARIACCTSSRALGASPGWGECRGGRPARRRAALRSSSAKLHRNPDGPTERAGPGVPGTGAPIRPPAPSLMASSSWPSGTPPQADPHPPLRFHCCRDRRHNAGRERRGNSQLPPPASHSQRDNQKRVLQAADIDTTP